MAKFKNITIKKKGGGTRLQRVKVLASGKYKFVKNKLRSRGSNPKTRTKTKKRKGYRLTKKRRRSREMTIPIAPIAGIFAAPASQAIIGEVVAGRFQNVPKKLGGYIGLWDDGSFHTEVLTANMLPIVLGCLVHKFVGGKPLNLNRTLAQAGVPFIRF